MDDCRQSAIDDALARAVVYRTLSLGFQTPTALRLRQVGAHDGFQALNAATTLLDRLADRCRSIEPVVVRLAAAGGDAIEALEADFVRLFGHTARGAVCAFETEYGVGQGFLQPQQLADLSGDYLAFGLHPALASDVRADHIACECEFMDVLNRKEAFLLANGAADGDDGDTLEITRAAARMFLRDHLGHFARAVAGRLTAADTNGFYGLMGEILQRFVEMECRRVNVQAGPADLDLRPEENDETPMACGSADQLIQIQTRPDAAP